MPVALRQTEKAAEHGWGFASNRKAQVKICASGLRKEQTCNRPPPSITSTALRQSVSERKGVHERLSFRETICGLCCVRCVLRRGSVGCASGGAAFVPGANDLPGWRCPDRHYALLSRAAERLRFPPRRVRRRHATDLGQGARHR